MKKLFILLLLTSLLYACKEDDIRVNAPECVIRIKKLYDESLKCTKEDAMEVNLYKGTYRNEIVYFPMTMCPHCSTVPPADGYTCDNKKIVFDDFSEVEDIKQVYNSCSKSYIEE
ncbi:hypothetical protein RYH73_08345 [Olivibacter sp. CPCC 100613]|uniref:hypothetical protein n=1 Tax=Olivibacter sp. CPCC 100613 TaxID=3079931 RepID=UPI002FF92E43